MQQNDPVTRLGRMEEKINAVSKAQDDIKGKVDTLLSAEARRVGREEAARKDENYRHDDRWQVWFRALVPTVVLTAIFNGLIALFGFGGGQ